MTLDLKYYIAVFFRRFHYFALAFAAVTVVAVSAAYKLPPAYVSTARLLMESSQIPDALAAPTVNTAALEQLQIIEQRLMTRANLLEIARKLRVFPNIRDMSPDDIVTAMRSNTTIRRQAGRDQATMMTISFEAGQAQTAAAVVNEYVTRILSDSASTRTSQAQDTLQFFKQEVDRLAVDLSNQSGKILEFQNKNADALPDTLDYRMSQQSNLQERLASIEREITSLKDQKQRLVEIFRSTGQVAGAPKTEGSPEAALLASLQRDLASALAIYSPENPKVKLLQSRVAQMEEAVRKQAADPEAKQEAPPMSMLDIQLAAIDSRIADLNRQREQVVTDLTTLKNSIDRTATNAITLQSLKRDYDNIQGQYNAATDRLAKASTGERIEALAKGQRIGVLDAATVPDQPSKPDRKRIIIMGLMGGVGLGLGIIVLLELLNSAVQRPVDLVRKLNITPIGTIPYIQTPMEKRRRRTVIGVLLILVVVGLPAAIYAIDTYYQPLDLILAKVSDRLGL